MCGGGGSGGEGEGLGFRAHRDAGWAARGVQGGGGGCVGENDLERGERAE